MRKLVLPLVLAASLAMSSVAFAATNSTVTGTITSINVKAEIVVVGHTAWHFAKGTDLSKLKVGEKVTVKGHAFKKLEVGVSIAPAAPMKPVVKTVAKTVANTVAKVVTTK